jgi:hypothetical protein
MLTKKRAQKSKAALEYDTGMATSSARTRRGRRENRIASEFYFWPDFDIAARAGIIRNWQR